MVATAFEITGRRPAPNLATKADFELRAAGEVEAGWLLASPNISLYTFDDTERCAVFVETPLGLELRAAPFFYAAQRDHATRLFTLPYDDFNTLAATLPDPNLALLYSVGRCGSTLLSSALGNLADVVSLSEPDVYTHAVGMREPGGSRDAELVTLLRSATRFLCREDAAPTWFIKFRGSCVEIADLMAQAFPEAKTLFLYRDLKSWARSMGRLIRVREEEKRIREAHAPTQAAQMSYSLYPRDRYNPLLRTLGAPLETRLESLALNWASMILRYLGHHEARIIPHALSYADLVASPEKALEAVTRVYGLSGKDMTRALGTFERDSQEGTKLSREALRQGQGDEQEPADFALAEAVVKRYGLEPELRLPGDMFVR